MYHLVHVVLLSSLMIPLSSCEKFTDQKLTVYRNRVVEMFQHAYDGYMKHAYPYDELRPLSCDGVNTWGSFSLTLIDALDTLAVMGNYSEFRKVAAMIAENIHFNININVSVFETNIRVVGGLLSAHLLSRRAGVVLEPGWPCSGPLLRLAEDVATRLLPAFDTKTGMPYGTVNLVSGVPPGETAVTCTAGVGTFVVEFAALSRLTGNPVFEQVALRALRALWGTRTAIGLVGNHIDVQLGMWTATDSGIGAGVDSYYEYLVKGAIMLQMPELMAMFKEYEKATRKYMKRDDWYFWVENSSGKVTMPVFQSLEAFWPGLLSLTGDLDSARKTVYNYHQIWREYGFTPEFYEVVHGKPHSKRDGYPLRPELVESLVYLYQATKDPHFLEMGVDILESIMHSAKTECGYATIRRVGDHTLDDRMESFFLAETTKYLYLLFTPDHFIHNNGSAATVIQSSSGECVLDSGGYVFNTEAHPIDVAAVHCCSANKAAEDEALREFARQLDLSKLLLDEQRGQFVRALRVAENSTGSAGESSGHAESVSREVLSPPSSDVQAYTGEEDPAYHYAERPAFTETTQQEKPEEEQEKDEATEQDDDSHSIFGSAIFGAETEEVSMLSGDGDEKSEEPPVFSNSAVGPEDTQGTTPSDSEPNGQEPLNMQDGTAQSVPSVDANSVATSKPDGEQMPHTAVQNDRVEAALNSPREESARNYVGDEDEFEDEMEAYNSEQAPNEEEPNPAPDTSPCTGHKVVESVQEADGKGLEEACQAPTETPAGHEALQTVSVAGTTEEVGTKTKVSGEQKEGISLDKSVLNSLNIDELASSINLGWRSEVKEIQLAPGEEEEVAIKEVHLNYSVVASNGTAYMDALSFFKKAFQEALDRKASIEVAKHAQRTDKPAVGSTEWLVLTCPSQPFTSRLAFRGEMFNVD